MCILYYILIFSNSQFYRFIVIILINIENTFQCFFIFILVSLFILLIKYLAIKGISLDIAEISATFNCEVTSEVCPSPSA